MALVDMKSNLVKEPIKRTSDPYGLHKKPHVASHSTLDIDGTPISKNIDLLNIESNLVTKLDIYNRQSAFSNESINQQYDKFNLRRDAFNRSYIKEPYILHGIQKDGGTAPNTFPLLTGADHLADDVARISKFMISPKGISFITKQVGLQLMNPRVETSPFWPIPLLPTTRIYNLGINTLASVATPMLHPWIYMQRHGVDPLGLVGATYGKVVKSNNELGLNRLVSMTDYNMISDSTDGTEASETRGDNRKKYYNILQAKADDPLFDLIKEKNQPKYFEKRSILKEFRQMNIGSVSGPMGPNSFFGIGNTNIKISKDRTPQSSLGSLPWLVLPGSKPEKYAIGKDLVILNKPLNEDKKTDFTKKLVESVKHPPSDGKISPGVDDKLRYSTLAYKNFPVNGQYLDTLSPKPIEVGEFPDFRNGLAEPSRKVYREYNPKTKFGMADHRLSTREDKSEYTTKLSDASDKINIAEYDKNQKDLTDFRDYIAFRFSNFNATEHIIFRATITGLSDTFTPTWNSVDILGRADPAYIYSKFERTISFAFKVAAMSRGELIQNYKRLNALAGYTTPTYSDHGMVGPFIRVTIGNYFLDTPAIITGLTYKVDDQSPWEINLEESADLKEEDKVAQLPHVIDVDMGLTIIGNTKPEFGGKFFMIDALKPKE